MSTGAVAFWSVIGSIGVSFAYHSLDSAAANDEHMSGKEFYVFTSAIFLTGRILYTLFGNSYHLSQLASTRYKFYLFYGWMGGGYCALDLIPALTKRWVPADVWFTGIWGASMVAIATADVAYVAWRTRKIQSEPSDAA